MIITPHLVATASLPDISEWLPQSSGLHNPQRCNILPVKIDYILDKHFRLWLEILERPETSGKHWNKTSWLSQVAKCTTSQPGVFISTTDHTWTQLDVTLGVFRCSTEMCDIIYRLKVEQWVHGSGLGIVVLIVHLSPVFRPPLCDQDGKGCRQRPVWLISLWSCIWQDFFANNRISKDLK